MSSDLTLFMFTVIDKAYLLNNEMDIILKWNAPYKEGFVKRSKNGINLIEEEYEKYLNILKLKGKPDKSEIKKAFKKLIIEHHPDKNPNDEEAVEKTRELITAYETLTGEEAKKVFGVKNEFYWEDLKKSSTIDLDGMKVRISVSLEDGEDWIYGTGISDDGERIYLGCYSGKTYQIDKNGNINKIYITQKIKKKHNKYRGDPIRTIREYSDRIYILTRLYLYIIKNDQVVKYLDVDYGQYSWFEKGIIYIYKNILKIYDKDGNLKYKIVFIDNIINVCFKDNVFLIENKKKYMSFLFEE